MKDTDKAETHTLGSSIEREVDAAFSSLEPSQENPASWGEETLELTDAMMPNLTQANDLSTLPLSSENDSDEIIELTDVASVEETGRYFVGNDDDILELTEIVQADQPGTETLELGDTSPDGDDSEILELTDMVPMEETFEPSPDDDDDILELTDAIESVLTESETPAVQNTAADEDDGDILELTDMVPVEEAPEDEDDDLLELTDIIEPAQMESEAPGVEVATTGEDDNDILELTDMVPPVEEAPEGEDDDLLELTDIIEPAQMESEAPGVEVATTDEDDIDILELTDMIPAEGAIEPTSEEEDDILELTQAIDPILPESDALADLASTLNIKDTDIPKATDFAWSERLAKTQAEEQAAHSHETGAKMEESEPSAGIAADSDEDIIDLADILDEQERGDEELEKEDSILRLDDILGNRPEPPGIPSEEAESGPDIDNDFNALGIVPDDMGSEGQPSVSAQDIEAAVERIILKKYGTTIETLIAKAVEKAVSREINSIKRTIMEDDDPAG